MPRAVACEELRNTVAMAKTKLQFAGNLSTLRPGLPSLCFRPGFTPCATRLGSHSSRS